MPTATIALQTACFATCAAMITMTWSWAVGWGTHALSALAACETMWFLRQQVVYHSLNVLNPRRPNDDVDERIAKFKTLEGIIDLEDFLSGWFMQTPVCPHLHETTHTWLMYVGSAAWQASDLVCVYVYADSRRCMQFEELRRDNVIRFIAYGFWYRDFDSMTDAEQTKVIATMDELINLFGISIPEGYNPSLEFMAHMWQPLRVLHKPFVFHVLSEASVLVSHVSLRILGFKRYTVRGHAYYVRGLAAPIANDDDDASAFAASDRVRILCRHRAHNACAVSSATMNHCSRLAGLALRCWTCHASVC